MLCGEEGACYGSVWVCIYVLICLVFCINPLPDMPILGSLNSAAKRDMMSENMDRWEYNYLIEQKTLWEKEKLLVASNFSFSHNVFMGPLPPECDSDGTLVWVRAYLAG